MSEIETMKDTESVQDGLTIGSKLGANSVGKPKADRVSVVVPVFNESATLGELVERLLHVAAVHEVILVDDGSDSNTSRVLSGFQEHDRVKLLCHEVNCGKGAALRTGFHAANGAMVVVQDADLEYAPEEIPRLIAPLTDGDADVVFGSRFLGDNARSIPTTTKYANRFLTWLSNCLTGLSLTDMETGHKAFRKEVIDQLTIEEDRFGVEPEITAKVARSGWRVAEIPVSYFPRDYANGKKIGWRDGIRAIWCIVRYR